MFCFDAFDAFRHTFSARVFSLRFLGAFFAAFSAIVTLKLGMLNVSTHLLTIVYPFNPQINAIYNIKRLPLLLFSSILISSEFYFV
jgi:hypothetical protein